MKLRGKGSYEVSRLTYGRCEEGDMFGKLTGCPLGRHLVTEREGFDIETRREAIELMRTCYVLCGMILALLDKKQ